MAAIGEIELFYPQLDMGMPLRIQSLYNVSRQPLRFPLHVPILFQLVQQNTIVSQSYQGASVQVMQ